MMREWWMVETEIHEVGVALLNRTIQERPMERLQQQKLPFQHIPARLPLLLFLNFHGGTGEASVHNSSFASRASPSNLSSTVSFGTYHQHQPLLTS